MSGNRVYRVTATYRPGDYQATYRRRFLSKSAAERRAAALREGYPEEEWGPGMGPDFEPRGALPPALLVTIEESDPITYPRSQP